ncbi:MAG: GDSL-type esterase/lipase family protein, partial [Ignavibacteriaceae bacterium]
MLNKKIYKFIYLLISFIIAGCSTQITNSKEDHLNKNELHYLALGDSYTIGESVDESERFPVQLKEKIREKNLSISDPIIIAKTGWTTDELLNAIIQKSISDTFNIVTLLIGVNNQYRGYDIEKYKEEFVTLLNKAIAFAGNSADKVFVISIPDWGVTPFAEGRDRKKIAKEIDQYNS